VHQPHGAHTAVTMRKVENRHVARGFLRARWTRWKRGLVTSSASSVPLPSRSNTWYMMSSCDTPPTDERLRNHKTTTTGIILQASGE